MEFARVARPRRPLSDESDYSGKTSEQLQRESLKQLSRLYAAGQRRILLQQSVHDGGQRADEIRLAGGRAQHIGLAHGSAGEEYRRANPDSAAVTYASFGYTAVTVNGAWTTGFETSYFMPAGAYEGEQWWLDPLPELATKMTEDDLPKEGLPVRISGYVSGPGRHSHLGAYHRRVYVREMNVLGIAQQPVAADRRDDAAAAER